ncbi:MAG: hypothetical protein GF333_02445 [Candidatus Omnitrophica bacterium]|nr:hypothetical protein [Candidatus Omnitrophota bacterium]
MKKKRKDVVRIFQVVSLGDDLFAEQIKDVLSREITSDPRKPEAYFSVTDWTEEKEVKCRQITLPS